MTTATSTNSVVIKLTNAITPIVSVGVGSAIWSVCKDLGLEPQQLQEKDLPPVKNALVAYYTRVWAHKSQQLSAALQAV
jgi:hypothetical protein